MILASRRTANAAINATAPSITANTIGVGAMRCSFNAASAVKYMTAKPNPCSTKPYSRFLVCNFSPANAAAPPAPNTAKYLNHKGKWLPT